MKILKSKKKSKKSKIFQKIETEKFFNFPIFSPSQSEECKMKFEFKKLNFLHLQFFSTPFQDLSRYSSMKR